MILVPIDKENIELPKTAFVYEDLNISLYLLVKFLRVFSEQTHYYSEKENQLTYFTLTITAMNKK